MPLTPALLAEFDQIKDPGALLAALHKRFGDRMAVATSGQTTDAAIVALAVKAGAKPRVVIRAIDRGAGIPNLPQIMSGQYRSKTGLGRGILGTKRLADQFDINTGAFGTQIVAEVEL